MSLAWWYAPCRGVVAWAWRLLCKAMQCIVVACRSIIKDTEEENTLLADNSGPGQPSFCSLSNVLLCSNVLRCATLCCALLHCAVHVSIQPVQYCTLLPAAQLHKGTGSFSLLSLHVPCTCKHTCMMLHMSCATCWPS